MKNKNQQMSAVQKTAKTQGNFSFNVKPAGQNFIYDVTPKELMTAEEVYSSGGYTFLRINIQEQSKEKNKLSCRSKGNKSKEPVRNHPSSTHYYRVIHVESGKLSGYLHIYTSGGVLKDIHLRVFNEKMLKEAAMIFTTGFALPYYENSADRIRERA